MIEIEYLEALTNARSINDLWSMHTDAMAAYGFDRLIYGYTKYRTISSLGDPEDFLILSNHSPEYLDGFIGKNYYHHAPMTQWALRNDGPGSWRIMAEKVAKDELTDAEKEVVAFNKDHNVLAGYTISFKSLSSRNKGAIALTARAEINQDEVDRIWEQYGSDILVLNNIVHLKIITLPQVSSGRVLTSRQSEVLSWVADGKTVQDISVLTGLKPATVEKHLRLAREALNVETTAQAVLKASNQNLINSPLVGKADDNQG